MFRVPKADQPPQNRQPGVVQLLSKQRKKKYNKTTKLLVRVHGKIAYKMRRIDK